MADKKREDFWTFARSAAAPRRAMFSVLGGGALLACPLGSMSAPAAEIAIEDITQPDAPGETAYMQRAFEMRRLAIEYGDQAYGALVVRGRKIIGQSWSRVILDQDPTGHAEMSAIRDAARRMNSRDFRGTVLYASSRPCQMCEAAAYWAGIEQMYHGAAITHAGPPRLARC